LKNKHKKLGDAVAEHIKSIDLNVTFLESIRKTPVGKQLELKSHPCSDCAVCAGFYKEHSEALKEASPEEKLTRSKGWFCHNNQNKACKGNAKNLKLDW